MDQSALVTEQIDAGARLASAFAHYKPLNAAFWIKDGEEQEWFLYLVSDQIDDSNFHLAYGEVARLFTGRSHLWLSPFQVKVAGVENPVAKGVLKIQQEFPEQLPARFRTRMIGGLYVEDSYIYALPMTVTT